MNGRTFGRWLGTGLLIWILTVPAATATTVLAPDFSKLVRGAELIFTGRVLEQRSEWQRRGGQRSIVTHVTFGVEQVHKGHAPGTITLQFLGGTVGAVTLDVDSMPRFTRGERVVLFVERTAGNVSPLVGLYHGRFGLQREEGTGREIIVQHDGSALSDVTEIGRARSAGRSTKARRAPLGHSEFAAKIREASVLP